MVYKDLLVPTDNMLMSERDIQLMVHEQNMALEKEESDKELREIAEQNRLQEEYDNDIQKYIRDTESYNMDRMKFLEDAKTAFVSSCIFKIFEESYVDELDARDRIIAKNLISNFVRESGASELLRRFKYENVLLAEMAKVCNNAYNAILEAEEECENGECDDNHPMEFKLDNTIVDDFYKDLANVDTQEASDSIKAKVSDAITEFIDTNIENKMDFKDIISSAQEQIATAKDESTAEYYRDYAQGTINEMKNTRYKNVFHHLVEALTKATYKDKSLNRKYVHEASVDMDSIVNSAKLIYTLMEVQQTTGMVSEDYIKKYIESFVNA